MLLVVLTGGTNGVVGDANDPIFFEIALRSIEILGFSLDTGTTVSNTIASVLNNALFGTVPVVEIFR